MHVAAYLSPLSRACTNWSPAITSELSNIAVAANAKIAIFFHYRCPTFMRFHMIGAVFLRFV